MKNLIMSGSCHSWVPYLPIYPQWKPKSLLWPLRFSPNHFSPHPFHPATPHLHPFTCFQLLLFSNHFIHPSHSILHMRLVESLISFRSLFRLSEAFPVHHFLMNERKNEGIFNCGVMLFGSSECVFLNLFHR